MIFKFDTLKVTEKLYVVNKEQQKETIIITILQKKYTTIPNEINSLKLLHYLSSNYYVPWYWIDQSTVWNVLEIMDNEFNHYIYDGNYYSFRFDFSLGTIYTFLYNLQHIKDSNIESKHLDFIQKELTSIFSFNGSRDRDSKNFVYVTLMTLFRLLLNTETNPFWTADKIKKTSANKDLYEDILNYNLQLEPRDRSAIIQTMYQINTNLDLKATVLRNNYNENFIVKIYLYYLKIFLFSYQQYKNKSDNDISITHRNFRNFKSTFFDNISHFLLLSDSEKTSLNISQLERIKSLFGKINEVFEIYAVTTENLKESELDFYFKFKKLEKNHKRTTNQMFYRLNGQLHITMNYLIKNYPIEMTPYLDNIMGLSYRDEKNLIKQILSFKSFRNFNLPSNNIHIYSSFMYMIDFLLILDYYYTNYGKGKIAKCANKDCTNIFIKHGGGFNKYCQFPYPLNYTNNGRPITCQDQVNKIRKNNPINQTKKGFNYTLKKWNNAHSKRHTEEIICLLSNYYYKQIPKEEINQIVNVLITYSYKLELISNFDEFRHSSKEILENLNFQELFEQFSNLFNNETSRFDDISAYINKKPSNIKRLSFDSYEYINYTSNDYINLIQLANKCFTYIINNYNDNYLKKNSYDYPNFPISLDLLKHIQSNDYRIDGNDSLTSPINQIYKKMKEIEVRLKSDLSIITH